MAIFDRLAFLEGEQAEAYKARKAKEEEDREKYRNQSIDRRSGYIMVDRDVKKGKLVDVDPHKVKNGIHGMLGRNNEEKEWNSKRSGSTNKNIRKIDKDTERFFDDEHRDGSTRTVTNKTVYNHSREDDHRDRLASKTAKKAVKPGLFPDEETKRQVELARDATNRNMRRHPKKWNGSKHESTIFESVRFLNE